MSLTTDPNDPCLINGQKKEGQNNCYLVLSDEERAKGFVRPVRDKYVHVGRVPSYKGIHRMLNEDEKREFPDKPYVAVMTQLLKEDGSFGGGPYVTQKELDAWQKGERTGGCNTETIMGQALAETYATNPSFYSGTFCCYCNKHFPVNEFVWSGTNETVGS